LVSGSEPPPDVEELKAVDLRVFARHFCPLRFFELIFSIPLQAQLFAEAWGVVLGKGLVGVLVGRVAL
jgi:hypothetical protein